MSDLYVRVCDPMQPHRQLKNGSECGVDCFVPVVGPVYQEGPGLPEANRIDSAFFQQLLDHGRLVEVGEEQNE